MPRTTPVTVRSGWNIPRNWQPHLALVMAQSITESQGVLEAGLTGSTDYSPKEWVCNSVHWGDTLSIGDAFLFLGGGGDHGPSWPWSKRAWRSNSTCLSVKVQTQLTVGCVELQMWCQATSCHAGHRVGIWVQSYIWRLSWIKKSCRVWWHWRGMESLEEGNTSKYPQKKPHFIPYSCSLEKASMLHCDPGSLTPFRQLLPDGSFLGDPSWHGSYWCDRKRSSLILEEFLQQLRNKQD